MIEKLTDVAWRLIVSARGAVASEHKIFWMSARTWRYLSDQRGIRAMDLYGVTIRFDDRMPYGVIELKGAPRP